MRLIRSINIYSYRPILVKKKSLLFYVTGMLIGLGFIIFSNEQIHEKGYLTQTTLAGNKTNISPVTMPDITSSQSSAVQPTESTLPALAFSHVNISTTVFWVGEPANKDNDFIANHASAWDDNWQNHYGGFDDPNNRNAFWPKAFTPKENPFYVALPYNDIDSAGNKKTSAGTCPNAKNATIKMYSWCKNAWIAIRNGDRVAYAQWEDAGPNDEDDTGYVFGTSKPRNTFGEKAGLDISPAVRDYLKIGDTSKNDWALIPFDQVPNGPWRAIITTNPGRSN